MKFLETSDTILEIRNLLNGDGPVRAAVSYWGQGAIEGLHISKGQDLTIVCDVLSGGCNPTEVRKLLRVLGHKRVLTFDRLHAKIWLAAGSAILVPRTHPPMAWDSRERKQHRSSRRTSL